ncbi:MAG: hypothetical protein ABH914_02945 [Candidatus Omnitrophota bacterium]
MALEDIVKKILGGAEEKAQNFLTEAEKEALRIQKDAEDKAQRLNDEIIHAKRVSAKQEALRITILARMEGKKSILFAKQKMLEQVFSDPRVLSLAKAQKTIILPEEEKQTPLDPGVYLKLLRPRYEYGVVDLLFK